MPEEVDLLHIKDDIDSDDFDCTLDNDCVIASERYEKEVINEDELQMLSCVPLPGSHVEQVELQPDLDKSFYPVRI